MSEIFNFYNIFNDDNYFFKIGLSSYLSDKLPKNDKKALKQFKDFAEKGEPKAQYYLGEMYKNGKVVEKNDEKANSYFIKAFYTLSYLSEEGNSESQYYLSLMFYNGYGCKKDLEKSFEWCKKSAEQGYDES